VLVISAAVLQVAIAQPPPNSKPTGIPPFSSTAPARTDGVHNVDPGNAYHRVYAVVPLVGSGKQGDPKRPMFAPLPGQFKKDHSGIIGFQWQLGDNKQEAIVEFVLARPTDVQSALDATAPGVIIFERGKAKKADIEAELQKHKQGFTLNSWIPVRPQ
jgi:hypothetical protein